jgi:hypothetical protein
MKCARFLGLGVVLAALLLSCASSPAPAGSFAAALREADSREITSFGAGNDNPYRPLSGMLLKSREEFVVLVLEVSEARGSKLKVEGVSVDGGNARFYDRGRMEEYWSNKRYDDAGDRAKMGRLRMSYLPSGEFGGSRGLRKYYFVLVGDRPMQSPDMVSLSLSVDGTPRELECRVEGASARE